MLDFLIRKAKESDARGIVEVNSYTWFTTYKELMPDELLENRMKTIDDRVPVIAKSIMENDNIYVAIDNDKVIGIMSYGKSRNDEYSESGEIYSIYVLKEYQGFGIGKNLFMIGINELINKGYNSMILNVLSGNSTIKFYEKYCGKKVGEKQDSFDDTILTEIIMYFEDLEDIYSKYNSKNANTIAKKN